MSALSTNIKTRNKIHPLKYALWIALGSITMMFAALSSAYVVRQSAGNWLEFQLPQTFFYSTVVLLISSLTIQLSFNSFTKGNALPYRQLLIVTFLLGILFVVLQYKGWTDLQKIGIELTGNPSGSFVYLISGVHAAHVLGGIACLIVALAHAFILDFKVTPVRILRFELVVNYWHFVDILWVYILIFFLFQR
ncbi:MAG: cytochrome c oxidase subunit 3 [Saprospiraceae bacterium]|nr:cytochrome c oxidase subunit 3 [Saprospiraceae bacterium]MBP7699365.1 cytochrome c oxidase subunit 3 [Saprospiraceae bacterium]